MKKRFLALALVVAISSGAAFLLNEKQTKSSKIWLGVGYVAAKKGATPEEGFAIGLAGLAQTTLWGAGIGGPVGAAVGAGFGL